MQLFVREAIVWLLFSSLQMAQTDEVVNITSKPYDTYTLETTPAQINKEDHAESTGVVLAEYPLKVKLELFSQL